jgi:hypothetical protein
MKADRRRETGLIFLIKVSEADLALSRAYYIKGT